MAETATIITATLKAASIIKRYWKPILIALFVILLIPTLIFSAAINILFPQVEEEEFTVYKDLTEGTEIGWTSFIAYDVVRLENYLKENNPAESIFNFIEIDLEEYEIIETEQEITTIVDGEEVTEIVIEKEYITVRNLKANGHSQIKELLETLDYNTSPTNMTVQKVAEFLIDLDKEEEYDIEVTTLSDEEVSENFEEAQKQWFFALIDILPLVDPTSEFEPDQFIIPELAADPDTPSIWPTTGRITSEFGAPRGNRTHQGIDIANSTGTPIYATANGKVIATGSRGNYGKTIMIYHGTDQDGKTYVTLYAHLNTINVSPGESVSQGETIGLMGSTGYSTGPHLHYEVRVNGTSVNPRHFLP